jgi:hypothetical protein
MKKNKACRLCNIDYPVDFFNINQRNKDKRNSICKSCQSEYGANHYKVQSLNEYHRNNEGKEFSVKICKKHGRLEHKDVFLRIYYLKEKLTVDRCCLPYAEERIGNYINDKHMEVKRVIGAVRCIRCDKDYPISSFTRHQLRKASSVCKSCLKEYVLLNGKHNDLWRRFRITYSQFKEMLEAQNFVCKICLQPETYINNLNNKLQALCVDHCHKTGKVRALLCRQCNLMIGHSKESPQILISGARYLELYDRSVGIK